MRVLTWNLFHGRAVPPAGREVFVEFAAALESWPWDVALLQEVPPWWPARLGFEHRLVLTSRNSLLPVRRAIAQRWPDLIKSSGGGCNAILARAGRIAEHRVARLRRLPERRWVHGVRLDGAGVSAGAGPQSLWLANVHAQGGMRDVQLAAGTAREWAGRQPLVLGGDFNVRGLALDGFERAGAHEVDYVFVRGLALPDEAALLERGRLSDHMPLAVSVSPP